MKGKWVALVGLSLLAWCSRPSGIKFLQTDFETARQQAQQEQKLLLTYFYTEW